MLNQNINPDHPLLIAFSVLDDTIALLGGTHMVTDAVCRDLDALFDLSGFAHVAPVFIEGGYIFSLRFPLVGTPNPRAKITVIFSPIHPVHERWEWVVHLVSTPPYQALSLEDRITLVDLQRDITSLLIDNPATEEVDFSEIDEA